METSKIILELIKALTASQIIYGAIVFTFLLLFKEAIRALIGRIAKIKLPGGGELSTPQSLRSSDEKPDDVNISVPSDDLLPPNLKLTPEVFKAERAKAALWEYRYLNYFLVPQTQRVLDWLSSLSVRTTISMFDSFWMLIIPEANERKAIINALQSHHLIVLNGELIEVTPKGNEYIQWRGPALAPPQT
ncbi:MAG: hypothetical protein SVZ03_01840 [Spirochaetota bacterium]|nr:hypothetical protein [Spirochaetota bacterium]